MIYYVYQYLRSDGSPYYIGMGHGNRMNDLHTNVITPKNKLLRQIISENLEESAALRLENALTQVYGLIVDGTGILENKIHGGNASPRGMLGKKHTEASKLKISAGNAGKIRTLTQRLNYKNPKTQEHAEKIRQANLGRKDDGRGKKAGLTKSKHKWYNNGVKTIMVEPGTEPFGYVLGRRVGI
jgi:hypothetical protein